MYSDVWLNSTVSGWPRLPHALSASCVHCSWGQAKRPADQARHEGLPGRERARREEAAGSMSGSLQSGGNAAVRCLGMHGRGQGKRREHCQCLQPIFWVSVTCWWCFVINDKDYDYLQFLLIFVPVGMARSSLAPSKCCYYCLHMLTVFICTYIYMFILIVHACIYHWLESDLV